MAVKNVETNNYNNHWTAADNDIHKDSAWIWTVSWSLSNTQVNI